MISLEECPYILDEKMADRLLEDINKLEERVNLLRLQGILTQETLQRYYGQKRFEHVAESNAIEGNTLSAGETELAVLKGITITGHDPAYIRDAIALDRALQRLTELAKDHNPTDLRQVREIHELIMGDRPSAGVFRNGRVRITGSKHTPPKTWEQVMDGMENWERWSSENRDLPAVIRATVPHAWFVHVHPFIDGNGRTARAITNLELVRAGYPSIIIKKKERARYINALGISDEGGDLSEFLELIIARANDAVRGLEQAAKQEQGYNPATERIRIAQERRLNIWNTSVSLLAQIIEHELNAMIEPIKGRCDIKTFDNSLELDDYIELCSRHPVSRTWSFIVTLDIPGMPGISRLAWFGFRSLQMYKQLESIENGGPSIFWSEKNPDGYPVWIRKENTAPAYIELTTVQGSGDEWYVMDQHHSIMKKGTTGIASDIAAAFIQQLTNT